MPFLLHKGAAMFCPHMGMADHPTGSLRVKLSGQNALNVSHSLQVKGCPFNTPDGPKPCIMATWPAGAARVKIEGLPALLDTSQGLTTGPLGPMGPPQILATQTRVKGI